MPFSMDIKMGVPTTYSGPLMNDVSMHSVHGFGNSDAGLVSGMEKIMW
jgi:hypothetical protein